MFYEQTGNGYILKIRVAPNASRCAVAGLFTDEKGLEFLKICLNTIPEKGKANQELITYLSKRLHIAKSLFSIQSGTTDRCKKIFIQIEPSPQLDAALRQLGETE